LASLKIQLKGKYQMSIGFILHFGSMTVVLNKHNQPDSMALKLDDDNTIYRQTARGNKQALGQYDGNWVKAVGYETIINTNNSTQLSSMLGTDDELAFLFLDANSQHRSNGDLKRRGKLQTIFYKNLFGRHRQADPQWLYGWQPFATKIINRLSKYALHFEYMKYNPVTINSAEKTLTFVHTPNSYKKAREAIKEVF